MRRRMGRGFWPRCVADGRFKEYARAVGDEKSGTEGESAVQIEPEQKQRRNPGQKFWARFTALD